MMSRASSFAAWAFAYGLATSGCLLTVDFDEYGSGGGSTTGAGGATTTSGATTSGTTGASTATGTGVGGQSEPPVFTPCESGDTTRFILLPESWRNVHVAQSGSGFVAAPDGVPEYVNLGEGAALDVRERDESTRDISGIFALLGSSGSIRPYAVLDDGEVGVAPFSGGTPSTLGNVLVDVHQAFPVYSSLLNSFAVSGGRAVGLFGFTRTGNTLDVLPIGLRNFLFSADGNDIRFYAHVMVPGAEGGASAFVGVVGSAPSGTVIQETKVPPGAFFVAVEVLVDGTYEVTVFSLADQLSEAQDVEFSLTREGLWVAGADLSGDNTVLVTGELGSAMSDGPALAAWPSRLAAERWLVNSGTPDAPEMRLHAIEGATGVLLDVGGLFGFEMASVARDEGNARIGTLVSAVVGDADVTVDGCLLPAGRRVLIEHDRDSSN